ncbi:MAG: hypothetical protein LBC49_04965 [Bacteroidales bacterium]|jgi:hypothetical protein|nr:hypothetical protein [Bacteroidales bacterium]
MTKKEQLRNFFWKRKVIKKLSKGERFRRSTNLENARQIGIYGIYKDAEQFGSIIKFAEELQRQGKVVKMLIYFPTLQDISITSLSMERLQPAQINFAKFPVKAALKAQHFIFDDFDILFDTSLEFHYIDVSIMSASNAKFKIGKAGEWNSRVNDFSISFKDGISQDEALKTVLGYLEIF